MSSISGVTSSPTWLQMLQAQSSGATTSPANTASTNATDSATSTDATTSTSGRPHHGHGGGRMTKALEDQGITGSKLTDLRSQIETAMKSAKSDGTDPKSAIDNVLSAAGVDMTAFGKEMAPRSGGAPGAGGPPPGESDSTSATSDTDSTTSASSTSALDALLDGSGISASSFKSSLMSMLNSGDSSATDTSSLFANASIGSSVDIAA